MSTTPSAAAGSAARPGSSAAIAGRIRDLALLPALLVTVLAGTATLACVWLLFYPWSTLLHELAETVGR